MRRAVAALVAMAVVAVAPAGARAGSFLDRDARVFTLQWPDGPLPVDLVQGVRSLCALPGGAVLFAQDMRGPNLWRLRLDGRAGRPAWAGPVWGLTTEPGGTPLAVGGTGATVQRLDLVARRAVTVGDLPATRAARWIAALDDGSIAVSDGAGLWRLAPGGSPAALPHRGLVRGLAPLTGGALAVLDDRGVITRLAPDGARRRLVTHARGALASLGDGRLVTVTTDAAGRRAALTVVGERGVAVRYGGIPLPRSADGATLRRMRWPPTRAMVVASDGSLVFATRDDRIRALVPRDSPRPRVAINGLFGGGRVGYFAGAPGVLTLDVLRENRTVARVTRRTRRGRGALRLALHGAYDLVLRLRTATAVTEARARGRFARGGA